jgi:branched-chain amino acid transport system permease protein
MKRRLPMSKFAQEDNMEQKKDMKKILMSAVLVIGILSMPLILRNLSYFMMLCCIIEIYIIAVSGLDILFGYCGQISMGHAAFYAIGCYTSAILHNTFGINPFITAIIAASAAAAIGALLAMPASKLVFHFLSMATIAFGEIVYQFLIHSPFKITGNFQGKYTDKMSLFGYSFNSYSSYYYFGLVMVAIFLLAKWHLSHSKTGRAFTAIRENTHAANGMGINVRRYKVMAFATSAFYTAFAGAMYVHLICYVHPDMFVQKQSVLFLTMLLFGGSGTLLGPILGVISVELLIENLRALDDFQGLVYGALMLLVIVAIPGGLRGAFGRFCSFIQNKFTGKETKESAAHANNG